LKELEFNVSTMGYILERANDTDKGVRCQLYERLATAEVGVFDMLSSEQSYELIRIGLRERYKFANQVKLKFEMRSLK
jgi:hypothetical protein